RHQDRQEIIGNSRILRNSFCLDLCWNVLNFVELKNVIVNGEHNHALSLFDIGNLISKGLAFEYWPPRNPMAMGTKHNTGNIMERKPDIRGRVKNLET
ncbi:LOW QUALITY PROTEIN: hypothetical protein PanWU01x14_148830, partial [Parasponia andersonii]